MEFGGSSWWEWFPLFVNFSELCGWFISAGTSDFAGAPRCRETVRKILEISWGHNEVTMKSQCRWKTEELRKIWPRDIHRHITVTEHHLLPFKALKFWRYSDCQSCLRIRNRTMTFGQVEFSWRVQNLKSAAGIDCEHVATSWWLHLTAWQRPWSTFRLLDSSSKCRYRGPPTLPGHGDVSEGGKICWSSEQCVLHDLFESVCVLFLFYAWCMMMHDACFVCRFYMISWQSFMILELGFNIF
jgi:hypothetical protein